MREIKFRAWDKLRNEMRHDRFAIYSKPRWKDGIHSGLFLEPDLIVPSMDQACGEWNASGEDDSIVLMQYTGLKDKHGKEIYEGDIVVLLEYGKATVEFADAKFMVTSILDKGEYLFDMFEVDEACEVIGDIYENPELLGGK